MKKKLAIIGASLGQEPLLLKAKKMEIETHCFAWEESAEYKHLADHFYPISVLEKEQILDVCKEVQIDGIVTMSSDICVPTVCYIAEKMNLIGNNYESALISTNKYLMRQAFSKNGVNIPRFTIVENNECDLMGFTYPLIVKPTDRLASIGVTKVEKEEDLKDAIELAKKLSYEKKVIVEEFIQGSEVLEVMCISWKGKHYPFAIEDSENMENTSFFKAGFFFPADLDDAVRQQACTQTKLALDALHFEYGASDVEIIIGNDGKVYIVEVNPRMAGEMEYLMVELSTGYDFLKGAINIALNQFEEPTFFPVIKYSGLYYLRPETEYLRPVIENWKNDPDIKEAVIFDEKDVVLERLGYLVYQSDRRRSWKPNHLI